MPRLLGAPPSIEGLENQCTFAIQEFIYNTLEWESRLILRLNAAKNIDYIEKWFKQKLRKIKFPTKNSVEAYAYLPMEWS